MVSAIDSSIKPGQIGLDKSSQKSFANYYLPVNISSIMNNQVFNTDVKILNCLAAVEVPHGQPLPEFGGFSCLGKSQGK